MEIQHKQSTIDWQEKVRQFVDAELIPWEIEAEMNEGVIPESASKNMQDKAIALGLSKMDGDFQEVAPDVTINYFEYVTNDLYKAADEACRAGRPMGDILLSSSVDQLMKLANDGCAAAHRSPETERTARWANWRDEVFGFTYEPSSFVYDSRVVLPEDVPR